MQKYNTTHTNKPHYHSPLFNFNSQNYQNKPFQTTYSQKNTKEYFSNNTFTHYVAPEKGLIHSYGPKQISTHQMYIEQRSR